MSNLTAARPYAKAVFAIALENKAIADWCLLLQTAAMILQNANVVRLLQNPNINTQQKLDFIRDLCQTVMPAQGENFLKLLAENHRLLLLPEIADLFIALRTEYEKSAKVEVTSAISLNDAEKQRITQAMKERLQREITLDCSVDKKLIGGMIIRIGDLVYDRSLRSQLNRLTTELLD